MACSEHKWIKAAWRRENTKKENSIIEEAMKVVEEVEVEIQFEKGNIWIDGELIEEEWKPAWKKLKEKLKNGMGKIAGANGPRPELSGINKNGIEERWWRTIKQSWCGTSSSAYEKPQLQEDQTYLGT